VALSGLAAAFLLGLVPAGSVFTGFADPAVVTVVEILIIAQAIGRSSAIDLVARKVAGLAIGENATVALLCTLGAAISVFMNNIGALAVMIPIAYSVSAARGHPLRALLMPISFATLIGGLGSLIGTPANLVVNSAEQEASGLGFAFFGFAPVSIPVAALGIVWLALYGWRLLMERTDEAGSDRFYPTDLFLTEVTIPAGSGLVGRSVSEVEQENGVSVHGAFRAEARIFARKENQILAEKDLLLVSGSVEAIRGFLRGHGLQPAVSESQPSLPAKRVWAETVVMPQSTIIGSPVGAIAAFVERNVQVVAISPQGPRVEGRLRDVAPQIGDILLLRGAEKDIADAIRDTQSVPLATRSVLFGSPDAILPVVMFAGAIVMAALRIVPPEIAFGGALLLMVLLRLLDFRAALRELNWPVIVMLAAMLPIGEALHSTGTADLLARWGLAALGAQSETMLIGGILLVAVLITPFLNNVTTAVILAPVAVSIAEQSGLPTAPFLVAVAIGVSTDFLTPFGHHNNTLVMGLGHYRFVDFPRVGAPLTLIVLLVAPPLIAYFF
jgi:di/tricarboxylate transporter